MTQIKLKAPPQLYESSKTTQLNQRKNPNNADIFQQNASCFLRYSIFWHCIELVMRINKYFRKKSQLFENLSPIEEIRRNNAVQNIQGNSVNSVLNDQYSQLNLKIIPNHENNDKIDFIFQKMIETLSKVLKEKQVVKEILQFNENKLFQQNYNQKAEIQQKQFSHKTNNQKFQELLKQLQIRQLDWKDLFYVSFKIKQREILLAILCTFIEVFATRFTMHILIQYLFLSVFQLNTKEMYMYAVIIGILYAIHSYFYSLEMYLMTKVSSSFRYGLIYLMIQKIVNLPQYSLKKAQIGKILNLISNDLNMIEEKFHFLGKAVVVPIYIIADFVLLILRYGWGGFAGVMVTIVISVGGFTLTKINTDRLLKINVLKDQRVKLTTQIIEGVKFIKTYAWQLAFQKIISKLRQNQIYNYYLIALGKGLEFAIGFSICNVISLVTIIVMYLVNFEELNTVKIFSILQLFVYLRFQMISFSFVIGSLQQIVIVLKRYASVLNIKPEKMINLNPANPQFAQKQQERQKQQEYENYFGPQTNSNFLSKQINFQLQNQQQEKCQTSIDANLSNVSINFLNCSVGWNRQTMFLKNINWKVQFNSYIGIAGKIGSGKSTLLYSILEEIPFYQGSLTVKGKIGYVQQEPVIFSMTIRDNILFEKHFNLNLYRKVLKDSCLLHDIENLPNKDMTIVGEKGITLSGGQKTRLALARALYADPDILILDDPFSAIDSKVGMQIFNNVITNYRQKRTIILATHHLQYYQKCDEIIFLENHEISAKGNFKNLQQKFKSLKADISCEKQLDEVGQKAQKQSQKAVKAQDFSNLSAPKEERFKVTIKSYINYLFLCKKNYFLIPFTLVLFVGSEVVSTFGYRFLANYQRHKMGTYYIFEGNYLHYWLAIAGLYILYFILSFFKFTLMYMCILFANKQLHDQMIIKLMKAPMKYFDTTPSGQIVSKFSNDLGILDYSIAYNISLFIAGVSITIVNSANIFQVNAKYMIPILIMAFLIPIIYIYLKQALQATHELDLVQKSPVFTNLSETITGLIQIKYYSTKQFILNLFSQQINNSSRANFAYWCISKLLDFAIVFISAFSFITVLLIGLNQITVQTAGQYALIIVFTIQVNDYFGFFFKQMSNMESNMVSFQRVYSIINLQSQKQFVSGLDKSKNYVKDGNNKAKELDKLFNDVQINIQKSSMRYNINLPLILSDLNLSIQPKQKIAIVGRTGSGKSSIVQFILRLTEPEQGSIYQINKQNALQLGLHTLRQNISVIPQKSFFFKNSLKKNLDPFDNFSDDELWEALQNSNLKQKVQKLENKLQANIQTIESTFSVGQQQLLSLSRVLLRKSKILILDEATSSVDHQTDEFIQSKIKQKFGDSTIITIAHRLTTIADYHKIATIDKGHIIQFDHPFKLIQNKGLFYEMVRSSGASTDKIVKVARESFSSINFQDNNDEHNIIDENQQKKVCRQKKNKFC